LDKKIEFILGLLNDIKMNKKIKGDPTERLQLFKSFLNKYKKNNN
jgi:hypothetical protein